MNREEMKGIYRLLKAVYPTAKQLQNREMWAAWLEELAPYNAADVEKAVRKYARKSSFFPSLSDLIVLLPAVKRDDRIGASWAEAYISKPIGQSISRYAREHGISWEQAEKELMG